MKNICLLLLILPFLLFSQAKPQKQMRGIVMYKDSIIQDVTVINKNLGKFSRTNSNGFFKVSATKGDTLLFSHLSFSTFSKKITYELLEQDTLRIQVPDMSNRLEEVQVNAYPNINVVSVGIIDEKPNRLTKNQRRLKTAGDFKPIHLLSILGGSLPLDPIINKISGRTKKLKKLVKFDQDEKIFDFIVDTYEEYIKGGLGILEEEFTRFVYVLASDPFIQSSIEEGYSSQLKFFIQNAAIPFKSTTAEVDMPKED